jgi:hypothetical protein
MKKVWKIFILSGLVCLLIVTGKTGPGWTQSQNEKKSESTGLQQRIDFGNSYIMGQSIKSGAVYLLHRKQSDIKSMLQFREDYRREILEDFSIQEEIIQNANLKTQDPGVFQKPAVSK